MTLHLARTFLLVAIAVPAAGATFSVAMNGTDSNSCGTKSQPCRTISRAIENAGAGDTILVGPGIYGNLNGDTVLNGPTEENAERGAECACVLLVDKPVRLLSRDGAGATLVTAGEAIALSAVEVTASGTQVGGPGQGFTLSSPMNEDGFGLRIAPGATGVVVSDVDATRNGWGFRIEGDANRVQDCSAVANGVGFAAIGSSNHILRSLARSNVEGMWFEGDGNLARDLAATANFEGISFYGTGQNNRVERFAALANMGWGVVVGTGSFGSVQTGSIYGNDLQGEEDTCGLRNLSGGNPVAAQDIFWGAAAGPGFDPADRFCGEPTTIAPIRAKEFRPKLKRFR